MNNSIFLSVVLPVYNSGGSAIQAIASVVAQGYSNTEVIVVNDGSTDDSLSQIVAYIESIDSDLKFKVFSQLNGGVSAARNRGIREASGEFIAFLDSDDQWIEGKLRYQMDFMAKNEDVAMTGTLTDTKPFNLFLRSRDYCHIVFWNQFVTNSFQPSTVIVRSKVLDEVGGFPLNRRYAEEGDLFFRLTHSFKCVLLNRVFTYYGDGKGSYGESGLSGDLEMMWAGELLNAVACYERKHISSIFLILYLIFSFLKFSRRRIITKLRVKK